MNEEKRREEKRREEVSTCQQKGLVISRAYLTNREMDMLACICSGYTLKSTAKLLKISENTAKSYLNSIKEKANCKSKSAIIKRFTKLASDHLIIKRQLDKILNISMSPLKRYFVTHKVAYGALTGFVLAGTTLLLNSGDKDPINYEIQLPSEQMTLPREGVMTSIFGWIKRQAKAEFCRTNWRSRYWKNNTGKKVHQK